MMRLPLAMELTVLLFGPAAAALGGQGSVCVPVPSDSAATVADLGRAMRERFPPLAPMVATGRFAVNHSFAGEHDRIGPGDEIALIAMVSGG